MKKITALLLTCLVVFTLFAACGKKDENNQDDNKNPVMDNDKNNGDNNPVGDLAGGVADGVGDVANGAAMAAEDVWDGLMDMFGADAPRTTKADDAVFARDYGIDEGLIEDYSLQTPEGEDTASEFFIARVKEGKMAQVEEALEKRKTAIADKWKDSTDEKLSYAKEPVIIKNGNYIMLAVHENLDKARTEFEKLTKTK